ncbi:replication-associated protein [Capybara virus 24_cap1_1774]|nr:replication-associated protein [Capybara virus 24_cap1_1774]
MGKPVRRTHFDMPEAHWESANGSAEDNIKYCSKEETRIGGPYIFGTPSKQGRRSDLLDLRDAVRAGKRGVELFDDDLVAGAAIKYQRGVDAMVTAYTTAPSRPNIRVVLHYGPAGTGKTHCAHVDGAYYYDGSSSGFWPGYKVYLGGCGAWLVLFTNIFQGERIIVLDEFGGHTLQPLLFQRLCDVYPLTLSIKGGQVPCMAEEVHICTNYLPNEWWSAKTKFNQDAVYRRIHEVHWHYEFKKYRKFVTHEPKQDVMNWAMTQFLACKLQHEFVK